MSVTAIMGISLDGVIQAPGRPDEDTRGGFRYGGWFAPYGDETTTDAWGERIARATAGGAFLFGRQTYLNFIEGWPRRAPDHQYTKTLTETPKYVATTTLTDPLPWENSTRLTDPVRQVADLKQAKNLVIMGSGTLVRSLMQASLIDELLLTIAPLVLGQGQRLFPEDGPYATLTLAEAKPTATGVIIAAYRAAG